MKSKLQLIKKNLINIYKLLINKWNQFINFKVIKKIFLFLPQNIFVFALLIFSIFTIIEFNTKYSTDYVNVYSQSIGESTIGPILKKTKIDLDFIDTKQKFSYMCFRFGTYARKNDLDLTVSIENNKKAIYSETISASNLIDGQDACFYTKKLSLKDLKKYEIYITPSNNASENNTVTIFSDSKGNATLSLAQMQDNSLKTFSLILMIIFILVFLLINYLINTKKLNCTKFYKICLLFIIPILFLIPAYQIPDEYSHFYRAYNLSETTISPNIYKSFNKSKIIVPKNIGCLTYAKTQMSDKIDNFDFFNHCMASQKNISDKVYYSGTSSLFGFVPQAIGIKIADIFTNSPLFIFYFGRLFTCLVTFAIILLTIKITPRYKQLFLLVATMLMFVQQGISYSYDAVLNAISLLYIAYSLKLIYEKEEVTIKDFGILSILLILINNIKKFVYLPLIIFMFLIPKDKFKNKNTKNKIFMILLSIIVVFAVYVGLNYFFNIGHPVANSANKVSKGYTYKDQLSYLMNNPIDILKIAVNTVKVKGNFYIESLVGYFGWFKYKVNYAYAVVYLGLFMYVVFGSKNELKKYKKVLMILAVLMSISLICFALYIYWSGYRLPYVEGVQGRYFIPLLLPLFIAFVPKKEKYKISNNIIYSSINIILLQYILIIISWYY